MIGEESAPSPHSRQAPFHTLILLLRSLGRAQGAGLEADTLLKDQNEVLKAPGPEIGVWLPALGLQRDSRADGWETEDGKIRKACLRQLRGSYQKTPD